MDNANVQLIRLVVMLGMIGYIVSLFYYIFKLKSKKREIINDQMLFAIWVCITFPRIFLSFFNLDEYVSREVLTIWFYSSLLYIVTVVITSSYGKYRYFWKG